LKARKLKRRRSGYCGANWTADKKSARPRPSRCTYTYQMVYKSKTTPIERVYAAVLRPRKMVAGGWLYMEDYKHQRSCFSQRISLGLATATPCLNPTLLNNDTISDHAFFKRTIVLCGLASVYWQAEAEIWKVFRRMPVNEQGNAGIYW